MHQVTSLRYQSLRYFLLRQPKCIDRQNLNKDNDHCILGKGAFGTCEKMKYRGIDFAVKTYGKHARAATVSNKASIISKFDQKGKHNITLYMLRPIVALNTAVSKEHI